jgi:hypothetical protein
MVRLREEHWEHDGFLCSDGRDSSFHNIENISNHVMIRCTLED